jgi:hypothetical protein
VLIGIGIACNLMGTLKLITLWYMPRHFGTLSAIVFSLGTVGNLVAAFTDAFLFCAACLLVTAAIYSFNVETLGANGDKLK